MRSFFYSVLLCGAVVIAAQGAFAQGSPYDAIGFGLPVRSGSATIDALGGTGVAMEGTRIVNELNPALWTWLSKARFDAAMRFDYTSAQLGTAQDAQHNYHFSGAAFGAPIWAPINAAMAIGYVPLTDASNQIHDSSAAGNQTYIVRGGTNLVFLGFSARPVPEVALGARLDLITGDIRHLGQVSFADTTAASGEFERDYFYQGLRPTFGFEFIGDSIGWNGLSIGATYSLASNLTATRETITTPTSSSLDTTIDSSGIGRYPAAFSAGISIHLSRRYRAEADYSLQDFSSAYVFAPKSGGVGDSLLRSSNRISFGIERLANVSGEYGTSFGMDRWALRLGLSYGTLPIMPNNSIVREFSLSAGVGIPISFETLLNLSFVGGQRIPQVANAAPKETFLRLGADVSFSEQWFVPTRRNQ